MQEKFYRSPEFLALQNEWREKLKEDGFEDIEYQNQLGDVGSRFRVHALGTPSYPLDERKATAARIYYQMAAKFLWDFSFKKPRHKFIWRLHSLGYSNREINRAISGEHNAGRVLLKIKPLFYSYVKAQMDWEENDQD